MKKISESEKTLKVKPSTHLRLRRLGWKGETYDDIIVRLLDFYAQTD
jgi:hypothetical protein